MTALFVCGERVLTPSERLPQIRLNFGDRLRLSLAGPMSPPDYRSASPRRFLTSFPPPSSSIDRVRWPVEVSVPHFSITNETLGDSLRRENLQECTTPPLTSSPFNAFPPFFPKPFGPNDLPTPHVRPGFFRPPTPGRFFQLDCL